MTTGSAFATVYAFVFWGLALLAGAMTIDIVLSWWWGRGMTRTDEDATLGESPPVRPVPPPPFDWSAVPDLTDDEAPSTGPGAAVASDQMSPPVRRPW